MFSNIPFDKRPYWLPKQKDESLEQYHLRFNLLSFKLGKRTTKEQTIN